MVMPLNADIAALDIGFTILGKHNCTLVILVNDNCIEEKICILRLDKRAEVKSNQTTRVKRY